MTRRAAAPLRPPAGADVPLPTPPPSHTHTHTFAATPHAQRVLSCATAPTPPLRARRGALGYVELVLVLCVCVRV
jgi:hypothetical protein